MSEEPIDRALAGHWTLDPEVVFLNHGSFGATLRSVQDRQAEWRARIERQPVQFFVRDYEGALDEARESVAHFVGADVAGFGFVANATTGVNAVLRSLRWAPGDELLTTDHAYAACANALRFVARRWGAKVVVADLPFPDVTPDAVVDRVLAAVTSKTRLALLDHITSPTGLVLPLERLIPALRERGVRTLIDGAHAPGQLPLDVGALGADYYTGNFHKWVCAPKGAAFLWVAPGERDSIRPVVISHGAGAPFPGRSRFHSEFDWVGTVDPTAFLCVPDAIRAMGALLPGGWEALRARNRRLALAARDLLCRTLSCDPPAPDAMIAHLVAVPLPDGAPEPPSSPLYADPLQAALLRDHGIEVPIVPWPASPRRLVRISAQGYNQLGQFERLASALRALLTP